MTVYILGGTQLSWSDVRLHMRMFQEKKDWIRAWIYSFFCCHESDDAEERILAFPQVYGPLRALTLKVLRMRGNHTD